MASEATFSSFYASLRRSNSLSLLLAQVDLSGVPLVQTIASVSSEIVSCFSGVRLSFQRRNSRSLIRKIEFFLVLFQYLADSGCDQVSSTSVLCFKELYVLLYHSKLLLRYCSQSSKLWLLLQNPSLSGLFHDLSREILILLDVFPVKNLNLSDDIREQLELLHKQSSESTLFIDHDDEMLRYRLYSFLDGFENGRIPDHGELRYFFVEKLGLRDPKSYRAEIEFLEEQMVCHGSDSEPSSSVINGFVDITRYAMFSLFTFEDECVWRIEDKTKKQRKCLIAKEISDTFTTLPMDFVCPISHDVMKDPVTVSTGHTYDRSSITSWIEEGRCTCPKTRQNLVDTCLVPNRALKSLMTRWYAATGRSCASEFKGLPEIFLDSVLHARASTEANKASLSILIQNLADGSGVSAQRVAVREIRLLAKAYIKTRILLIAEVGVIPHLRRLLESENATVQENSISAIFNLSRHSKPRSMIMEEKDCLESIVSVLASGITSEARENAAATLLNLSSTQVAAERIANADGCIGSHASLLQNGTPRGKLDVIVALQNMSMYPDSCNQMVRSGGASALVGALADEDVAEKAARALALVANHSLGAESIGREESAVSGLMKLMRCGTPKGGENAVAALLQLCRGGGAVVVEKVAREPGLAGLTGKLRFTGTKRARRKAISLSQVLKGYQNTAVMPPGYRLGIIRTDVSVPISICT
ncbi:unnamed protein product [Thlaspi arvense]|uniref:RING-type E3 ubiquitin transferase n=1 Tax=Thlaspi arvense TaxID=13288 RepID=A0AAU9S8I6_THLAR|nr:unnamed protein product [Thlaspi arvense]